MIQINLLPIREARRRAGIRQQAMVLGLAAGLGLLVCVWIHVSIATKQNAQLRQIAVAKSELKELEVTRARVEKFRSEREEIERKLKIIDTLEMNRTGPVRIMDEIAMRIPKRMWLTELTMDQGVLTLEGESLDAEIVAAFLTSLAESELISDVELESTRLEEREGLKLNSFAITSRYQHGSTDLDVDGNANSKRGTRGKRRKKS